MHRELTYSSAQCTCGYSLDVIFQSFKTFHSSETTENITLGVTEETIRTFKNSLKL